MSLDVTTCNKNSKIPNFRINHILFGNLTSLFDNLSNNNFCEITFVLIKNRALNTLIDL